MQKSIVLGIGCGRCGMQSLAAVLNAQDAVQVTHERPPLLPWRCDARRDVMQRRLDRLRSTLSGRIVGDIAHSYLPYVEEAIAAEPNIRVVCLQRSRDEVVRSFCLFLDRNCPLPTNHWVRIPTDPWYHDPVWTRTYPQYEMRAREDGIRRYWDEYHQTVVRLSETYPDNVRLFDMHSALSTDRGQQSMLSFVGVDSDRQVLKLGVHLNKTSDIRPPVRERSADAMSPQRCVVLVPYSQHIESRCERGLTELERRGYTVWRVPGYAAIDQGRNQLATNALVAGFEETMWIDADIGFEADAVERLRSHNAPVVCGIYAQKGRREVACHVLPGTSRIVFGAQGGMMELRYGATGFLLVRRRVYETIQQELAMPVCNEWAGSPTIGFFQPMVHSHEDGYWYLAEDYAFCQRVRACGFKIMADTSIRLWHVGTHAYSWEEAGLPQQRFDTFHLNLAEGKDKASP